MVSEAGKPEYTAKEECRAKGVIPFIKSAAFKAALAIVAAGLAAWIITVMPGGRDGVETSTVPPHMDFSGGGYATLGHKAEAAGMGASSSCTAVGMTDEVEHVLSSAPCAGVLACRGAAVTPDVVPVIAVSGCEDYLFASP